MNRDQAPQRRRNRLLELLFGPPKQQPLAPASTAADDDPGRAALLGSRAGAVSPAIPEPAAPQTPPGLIPRDMYRVNVNVPANLDIGGEKTVAVRLTNMSGTGAAILYDSGDDLPPGNHWLDLALPNRQKPLEIEVELVTARQHTGPQGQDQQIVHVRFPTIRRNDQDAIIAYINNLRLYESKQFSVTARVILEVVTGRRRFAKFKGETIEIRPDMMRLMMEDFDAIAGSEVMLTIQAQDFSDHIDVEDVKVEKVEVVDPRHAEVEVSLTKPDDRVLVFIRKHYPSASKARR
ncbi:MAG: PilZ domain-containing protein [Chloroflexi bacterium]|nr:PilZ domain-containing protein [Chloroflexota bacterium]